MAIALHCIVLMVKVAIAVIVLSLSACLGDIPADLPSGPTATSGTARALFDGNVYPIVASLCAGCHASLPDITRFVSPDPAAAYDEIVSVPAAVSDFAPADAPILTKLRTGHQGIAYSPDQIGKITRWLEQEVSERGAAPPPFPSNPSPIQAMERTWSGCLTLADFRSANMAQRWGNLHTDDDSTCTSCHTNGGFGHVASDYESLFFNLLTKHSGYMLQYFAIDAADPAHPAMIVNAFSFTQVSQALDKHLEHPTFDPAIGMIALQTFFDAAAAKLAAGQCGTPTLQD